MRAKTAVVSSLAAIVVIATAALAMVSTEDRSWEIREYDGMPCLWQNGLPYFGGFGETDRQTQDLAGVWRFVTDPEDKGRDAGFFRPDFDDSGWSEVTVPHAWNTRDSEHSHYQGAAWYRLRFIAGPGVPNGLARLYFDGVCFSGEAWLNGRRLGGHHGGYSAWSLDATAALEPGEENVLAVLVDNRRGYDSVPPRLWEQEKLGWWPYGGITRLVRVEWSPAVSVNKVTIEGRPEADGGGLMVSGLAYNRGAMPSRATVTLRGLDFPLLERVEVEVPPGDCARFVFPALSIEGALPWSPEHPFLYGLSVKVESKDGAEEIFERVGFVDFRIEGGELYLNGEPYWMRGINRHEDDPVTGLYQSDARMAEDMALLHELRVNHMRPGHYPNDRRWLSLCDREGITLIEEIPLYQASSGVMKWFEAVFVKGNLDVPLRAGGGYPTMKQMTDEQMLANAELQLIEMIERDRNHPSIIMWSVGNENFTFLPRARRMYERLTAVCRRFDPAREVSFALLSGPGVSPLLEQTGDLADVIFLNEYYGWYFGEASQVGKFLDRVHAKYPDKPIVVSEFGAGAVWGRHSDPPEKFSEEYQVMIYKTQFSEMLARPFVKGSMPWILADFRCPWFLEEHPVYEMNLKGVVDYERRKKAAFEVLAEIYSEIEAGGD